MFVQLGSARVTDFQPDSVLRNFQLSCDILPSLGLPHPGAGYMQTGAEIKTADTSLCNAKHLLQQYGRTSAALRKEPRADLWFTQAMSNLDVTPSQVIGQNLLERI